MNRRIVKVDTSTGERLGDATDCITVLDDAADGNGIGKRRRRPWRTKS